MSTTIIQVKDLTGKALDWATAKAMGYLPARWEKRDWGRECVLAPERTYSSMLLTDDDYPRSLNLQAFQPSEDWARGGPIIEREEINVDVSTTGTALETKWVAIITKGNEAWAHGPTPLIAAMRCLVESKLGPEVEIPDELATPKLKKGMTL